MSSGIPCMWMRGGTSKGAYFLAGDLPADPEARDAVLLNLMGSPDPRQIDGIGGGDPLTSKVAVVSRSAGDPAEVDYLFLQVFVDQALVSDTQNCGNILAGVGPFAIERGLVAVSGEKTPVTVNMLNSGQRAKVSVATPRGVLSYAGNARIDGVPGVAAPVSIEFQETAGSSCGALFPTGHVRDTIQGIDVTLIDNGMPVVVMEAAQLGIRGQESPAELEADHELRDRLEAIRLEAGPLMNLGDVSQASVPKLSLLSLPRNGGAISTRTFIPHRCHKAIGVLGAVSVATSIATPGAIGNTLAVLPEGDSKILSIEHPTGEMTVICRVSETGINRSEVLRTDRKLMYGQVFLKSNL
ncbi:MAG: 4-oxalomesaconate tautomerase [Boseongicola sp.]|nr:4-oxalomesaconate tautomerase [Boseongicola sp.]